MSTYNPPVDALLNLGRPDDGLDDADYAKFGIGLDHVPELIRLVRDEELAFADSDSPVVYAQIHAWRALGHLRAEAAIEPLLDLLAAQDGDDWNDWTTEEVPRVLGMIGPAALQPTVARLENRGRQEWPPVYFAGALVEIAKRHPQTRQEVIAQLSRVLDTAADNDPGVNGSVVGDLLDLDAVEAWPTIEKAFATGNVDASIAGDVDDVKYDLGLGPKPPSRVPAFPPPRTGYLRTAKERADARAKTRKTEKKKAKKKRKGK